MIQHFFWTSEFQGHSLYVPHIFLSGQFLENFQSKPTGFFSALRSALRSTIFGTSRHSVRVSEHPLFGALFFLAPGDLTLGNRSGQSVGTMDSYLHVVSGVNPPWGDRIESAVSSSE